MVLKSGLQSYKNKLVLLREAKAIETQSNILSDTPKIAFSKKSIYQALILEMSKELNNDKIFNLDQSTFNEILSVAVKRYKQRWNQEGYDDIHLFTEF